MTPINRHHQGSSTNNQKNMLIVITCHLAILDDLVKKDMPIIMPCHLSLLDNLTKKYKTHVMTH